MGCLGREGAPGFFHVLMRVCGYSDYRMIEGNAGSVRRERREGDGVCE